MHANTMNLFGISFILVSCLSSLCVQPALANWPVFFIEKGGRAVVPCVPKGDETAYFWSKGEDFATSQSVASRVLGIPSSDSEKYLVNEDGSLVIYNVTLAEGGRYHCRIVSENTNCRGAVSIEVTVNDFTFGIEQCEPSESCTLQVEPSKETKLTCTAKGGPSSLSLKWFNGSKEINSVSKVHPLNEESSTVSETITVPNEFGLPLTCEAVASEDGQACARLAHVRLDKSDTAKEPTDADKSSARWIIPLVLLIFAIVLIVFLVIYIYAKRQKHTQKKKSRNSEHVKLLADEKIRFEKVNEELENVKKALTAKNTKLTNTTGELEQVKKDLIEKETKLTQKDGQLTDLQDKFQKTTGELEQEKKDLTENETKLTQKDGELADLRNKFQKANEELENVKKALTAKNTKLTKTTGELEQVKKDLTGNETKLTQKDGELADLREKFQKANEELERVKKALTAKNTKLTKTTGELEQVKKDLTGNETKLTKANEELENVKKDPTATNSTPTDGAEGQ